MSTNTSFNENSKGFNFNTGFCDTEAREKINSLENALTTFIQTVGTSQNSLMQAHQNALAIAEENNNKITMFGKTINTILHIQEEQDVRLKKIEDGFEIHKENEMITPAQAELITNKAFKRLIDFLNPDTVEWTLYHKAYFGDMYTYVRNKHYLAKPIACTRRKDFDNVMEGFDCWYPDQAVIKEKADKRRKNRLIAKKIKEKMLKEIEENDLQED